MNQDIKFLYIDCLSKCVEAREIKQYGNDISVNKIYVDDQIIIWSKCDYHVNFFNKINYLITIHEINLDMVIEKWDQIKANEVNAR